VVYKDTKLTREYIWIYRHLLLDQTNSTFEMATYFFRAFWIYNGRGGREFCWRGR